ncbi:EAL domain-containing protein [Romeria aff. gracilis LEGE 07310]|uniref:EAL domain-containing protein n=1 Tax=Vasconcelosia minhoensis LEGE 07310 TaxID=915328 RepID=A0A8J7AQF3_9CYAN|nr:EAL domain-containing protein [Romeria gracilis]MBE9078729.1 EAL domain-containing protein [Romeria aff. gracilis LEGE 07310]
MFRAQKNLSLSVRLSLAFGGIAVLLTLVIGEIAGKLAMSRTETEIGQELAHISEQMADELDRTMFERFREIQLIAGLEPFRDAQTPAAEQQALLDRLQETYSSYSWIGFANHQGTVESSTKALLQGQSVAQRPWFMEAQRLPYVGDVHEAALLAELLPNTGDEPLRFVDVSAPVFGPEGNFLGVLGAHLSWEWAEVVGVSLLDSAATDGKEVFILAEDGTILLGPPDWIDRWAKSKKLDLESVRLAQAQYSGHTVERWPNGELFLTGYSRSQGYRSYPGLGWILLVREPAELAFAPAQQLYQQILIGGMVVGSSFAALGWLAATSMTRPMQRIAAAADRIRRGDRSFKLPALEGQRETASLSQALNQLVTSLVEQEQLLKAELAERKRLADSLYRSEEQLRQITDNIDAVFILKPVGSSEQIYSNSHYREVYQYLLDIPLPQRLAAWIESMHPDDRAAMLAKIEAEKLGQPSPEAEYRLNLPDGTMRWMWNRSFPIQDERGEIYRYAIMEHDITQRRQSEAVFKRLVEQTAAATGEDFFSTIAEHLASALEVDHVFITEQLDDGLRTIAFWSDGELRPNFTYALEHTPCQLTLHEGTYYCASGVTQTFPQNPYLAELEAEGYFGVALTNALGHTLGKLCIVSRQSLGDRSQYSAILHIFASRAAAELERQRSEVALKESEARFRLLAENVRDLICLHQPNGRFLYLSPSCRSLLGFEPEQLVGTSPYALIYPGDREMIRLEASQASIKGRSIPITCRMRTREGKYIWLESLIKAITDSEGQLLYLQTSSRDVTDKVRVQHQLQYEALHDGLTQLPNRNALLRRLSLALERARQPDGERFAVLFVDLDRFKVINDSLGHSMGDRLLVEIARKLKSVLRPGDIAARISGDEFVLLLDDIDSAQAAIRVAERVMDELQSPIQLGPHQAVMSASIGIVMGNASYRNGLDLLRDADIAMYSAKAQGKARYAVFTGAMHVRAMRQLELENDLRQAVERGELGLCYQPIVTLATGQLLGFEVLARWQHQTKGMIPPAEFIPIAEESGLIVPLGLWILQQACSQMARWQTLSAGTRLKISVNLSVKQLNEPDLLAQVKQTLAANGLSGNQLSLEITESVLMENIEAVSRLLTQLRADDIQVSIDDFGTGFSSLSYLHRLPVNSLKIDQSFISKLFDSPRNLNIAETIIGLGDRLGIDAIAEGIETPEQLRQLQAFGCELGQGHLLGYPMTAEAAEAMIIQQRIG